MSLEVGRGRLGPKRKAGLLKMTGITSFKMSGGFARQGGMDFQRVVMTWNTGAGTSPVVFAVSPELRRDALQSGVHRKLLDATEEYDIARITNSFNRIWVRKDSERIPAVLTWQELGKLSSDLGVEMADLTCFMLEATDGGLRVSQDKNDPGSFSNTETRKLIFDFTTGARDSTPPVLYADVNVENRTFLLCMDESGSPVYLELPGSQVFAKYALAEVVFFSVEEIRVRVIHRSLNRPNHTATFTLDNPLCRKEAASPAPETPQTRLSRPRESKAIQLWLFYRGILDSRVQIVERMLGADGNITLTQKESVVYKLSGLSDLPKAGIIGKLKILLGEETLDGHLQKTARLFRMEHDPLSQPENCLAAFLLSSTGDFGVRIKV